MSQNPQTLVTVTIGGLDLHIDPAQGHVSYFHCTVVGAGTFTCGPLVSPKRNAEEKVHSDWQQDGRPAGMRVLLPVCPSDWMKMIWRISGFVLTGRTGSTLRKTCHIATLSATSLTWTDPESNPDLRSERPVSDHRSNGTASLLQRKLFAWLAKQSSTICSWGHWLSPCSPSDQPAGRCCLSHSHVWTQPLDTRTVVLLCPFQLPATWTGDKQAKSIGGHVNTNVAPVTVIGRHKGLLPRIGNWGWIQRLWLADVPLPWQPSDPYWVLVVIQRFCGVSRGDTGNTCDQSV